jgi:hypothetical protein
MVSASIFLIPDLSLEAFTSIVPDIYELAHSVLNPFFILLSFFI